MGGCCCCCASRAVEINGSPRFYHYPRVPEERETLSSHQRTISSLSTGLLADTNLDTSIPNTYRPPSAPIPYDTFVGNSRTSPINRGSCGSKAETVVQATTVESVDETNSGSPVECTVKDLKNSNDKVQANIELSASNEVEEELEKSGELKKSSQPVVFPLPEEEDICPTCLEEYDAENPKIITKCEHHFHLACILEWMERSDTCPVCDKEMIFSPPIDS